MSLWLVNSVSMLLNINNALLDSYKNLKLDSIKQEFVSATHTCIYHP